MYSLPFFSHGKTDGDNGRTSLNHFSTGNLYLRPDTMIYKVDLWHTFGQFKDLIGWISISYAYNGVCITTRTRSTVWVLLRHYGLYKNQ